MVSRNWAAVVTFVILAPVSARAFVLPAAGPDDPQVAQREQQALILHHDGREDLVLSIRYEATAPPRALAWIIPVPAMPDWFGIVPGDPFDEIARLTGAPAPADVPLVQTAGLALQPIRGRGPAATAAVVQWMRDGGFVPRSEDSLRYYADRDWTYLAVRVSPPEGSDALPRAGRLPALHIAFRSERAVYPLKAEAPDRFRVRLFLIAPAPLPGPALGGAARQGLVPVALSRSALSLAGAGPALGQVLREAGSWTAAGDLHVHGLTANIGTGAADPDRWDEELSVPPLPLRQRWQGTRDDRPEPPVVVEPLATEPRTGPSPSSPPRRARARAASGGCGCGDCTAAGGGNAPVLTLGLLVLVVRIIRRRAAPRR